MLKTSYKRVENITMKEGYSFFQYIGTIFYEHTVQFMLYLYITRFLACTAYHTLFKWQKQVTFKGKLKVQSWRWLKHNSIYNIINVNIIFINY